MPRGLRRPVSEGNTAGVAKTKDVAVMTDPDVVEATRAEPEDPAKCRVCNGGGDTDDWVGCDAPQCEYWIHLSCVGITMKPGGQKIPAEN